MHSTLHLKRLHKITLRLSENYHMNKNSKNLKNYLHFCFVFETII